MADYTLSGRQVEEMIEAYIESALWCGVSTGEDGEVEYDFTADDLAPDSLASMRADVLSFLSLLEEEEVPVDAETPAQMGHDLWLTQQGHGAGFWDRGLGEVGEQLTKWAHSLGHVDLIAGDDGLVYWM